MVQESLFGARQARDHGIQKVAEKNKSWLERALEKIPAMKLDGHSEVTGEGMRIWLLSHGLDHPSSQHAWGMMTRTAMKRGLIADTGRIAQMFTVRSHARRTPIWRIV